MIYKVFEYNGGVHTGFRSFKSAARFIRRRAGPPHAEIGHYEIVETSDNEDRIVRVWKYNEYLRRFQQWNLKHKRWCIPQERSIY